MTAMRPIPGIHAVIANVGKLTVCFPGDNISLCFDLWRKSQTPRSPMERRSGFAPWGPEPCWTLEPHRSTRRRCRPRITACRLPGFEPEHQSNSISNREMHLQVINSKSRSIAWCANQFGFDLIRPQPPLFRGLRISEA